MDNSLIRLLDMDFRLRWNCDFSVRTNSPWVIHGGTGLSDEQMRRLIGLGVAKINYYTALSDVAARSILEQCPASYTNLTSGVRPRGGRSRKARATTFAGSSASAPHR